MEPTLADLAAHVVGARDLESLTRPMLQLLEKVTGLETTYLTAIDEVAGTQTILYSRSSENLVIPEGLEVPWGDTLCRRALSEGLYFTNEVGRHWGDSEAARQLGITTYMSRPVLTNDGAIYGTLCAASSLRADIPAATMNIVSLFAQIIGQQIEREAILDRLVISNTKLLKQASADPLTGLPNRRVFLERLAAAMGDSGQEPLIVAFIDLDGFKAINDEHGHDVGDRFLIDMSLRLMHSLRRGDLIARFGGDEFVVASKGEAAQLKQRLEAATCGEFALGGVRFDYGGPSIGVVTSVPGEGVEALLGRADEAMYDIKRQRKGHRQ